jgi:hypothetical protein
LYPSQLAQETAQLDFDRLEPARQQVRVTVAQLDVPRVVRARSQARHIDQPERTGKGDFVPPEAAYPVRGKVQRDVFSFIEKVSVRRLGELHVGRLDELLADRLLERGDLSPVRLLSDLNLPAAEALDGFEEPIAKAIKRRSGQSRLPTSSSRFFRAAWVSNLSGSLPPPSPSA